jgi:hypothetical protein
MCVKPGGMLTLAFVLFERRGVRVWSTRRDR